MSEPNESPQPKKQGRVVRVDFVTRNMVEIRPGTIFVFGDNMQRLGMGGQARAMRGLANAIGIPTKWAPGISPEDYFKDEDLENPLVVVRICAAIGEITNLFKRGYTIVIPKDGIGTGLAELPARAPRIAAWINDFIAGLEKASA